MTHKNPTTPEKLEQDIIAEYPAECEMQAIAPKPCNLESEEFKKAVGEKALEILNGGRRIVNVKDVPKLPGYASWLTTAALRHIIFDGTPRVDEKGKPLPTNGLDKFGAVIRLGSANSRGRVLLDLNAFDMWVDAHREKSIEPCPAKK